MAIVQISKIIHRTGEQVDIPQLDTGEIGFSTDSRQVFIGNDRNTHNQVDIYSRYHTEILTDQSSIDFARLNGSGDTSMLMESPESGQLLGLGISDGSVVVTNLGGDAVTTSTVTRPSINLGDISNVKITGNAFNGAVLQTDGQGNLSWTTNGMFKVNIASISRANPAVVTTQDVHYFGTGASVVLYGWEGFNNLLTDGDPSGSGRFWIKRLTATTFSLYEDESFSSPIDSAVYMPDFVANTGYAWGGIASTGNAAVAGANTQLQFNDGGVFGASNRLTLNKVNGNLTANGNIIVNTGRLYGNSQGAHNGTIGATTPNTGAFTAITASATIVATSNVVGGNIVTSGVVAATGNITGANATVTGTLFGSNANITANVSTSNVVANSAYFNYTGGNAWHMFANATGIFFTDSGTGNTFQVNLTQI